MRSVRVGIGVVLVRGQSILIGKRLSRHGEGCWGLPGGYLEFMETFGECARREVLEETGLRCESEPEVLTVVNNIFASEKKHTVTVFMRAACLTGEPTVMEPDKCECWQWVAPCNLPRPLFLPLVQLVEQGFALVPDSARSNP